LDTRTKILSVAEAVERLSGKPASRVSGNFDPRLAEHIRRLRQHKKENQPLVVEIGNPPNTLLSQRARAELVAAISFVDFVVIGEAATAEPINDSDITEHFIEHVRDRHRAEGKA